MREAVVLCEGADAGPQKSIATDGTPVSRESSRQKTVGSVASARAPTTDSRIGRSSATARSSTCEGTR